MHSRIYQISEKPVTELDRIDESKYYDNFVGEIADYVSEIGEGADTEDIKWLGSCSGITVDPKKRTLTVTDKKAFFAPRFKHFKETVDILKTITEDDFCTDNQKLGMAMYEIENAYSDKFGFYIDDDYEAGYGLEPLNEWVRHAEPNKTYYIGTVIDYHY